MVRLYHILTPAWSCFRPLTGIVQLEKVYTKENPKFLPPYGDRTDWFFYGFCPLQFLPPYGDGTRMNRNNEAHFKFSSPYGDSTCTRTWKRTIIISFRPLTGVVPLGDFSFRGQEWFSPPYGDGTGCWCNIIIGKRFSPPYGDGTQNEEQLLKINTFSPTCGDGTRNV